MDIEHRVPTIEEYRSLRRAVDWKVPTVEATELALRNSTIGAVAVDEGAAVGMGRVVGDLAFYNLAVDLVVHPRVQRAGVGRLLVGALEEQVRKVSSTGHLQLVADEDVEPFYARIGYEQSSSTLLYRSVE